MKTRTRTLSGILAAAVIISIGLVAFTPVQSVAASAQVWRGGPTGTTGAGGISRTDTTTALGTGIGAGISNRSGGYAGSAYAYALEPLSDEESAALQRAVLEEYGALNLYNAVIDQFGAVIPFTQIVRAEQMHVNTLVRQADKYGIEVPANPGLSTPVSFTTLADACQAGVDAEIVDAALYDELMAVTDNADLIRVYTSLQSASLNMHLPAFEYCN